MNKIKRLQAARQISLYTYNELTPEAQNKAVDTFYNSNTYLNVWNDEMSMWVDMVANHEMSFDNDIPVMKAFEDYIIDMFYDDNYAWVYFKDFNEKPAYILKEFDINNFTSELDETEADIFDNYIYFDLSSRYHIPSYEIYTDNDAILDDYDLTTEEIMSIVDKAVSVAEQILQTLVEGLEQANKQLTEIMEYLNTKEFVKEHLENNLELSDDNYEFYEDGTFYEK